MEKALSRFESVFRSFVKALIVIVGVTAGWMTVWETVDWLRSVSLVGSLITAGCSLYAAWWAGVMTSRLSLGPVPLAGEPPDDSVISGLLAELAALEPNWDSYGGEPPTDAALASAYTYAMRIAAPPEFIPINDGSIELDYPVGVVVLINPDGTISSITEEG